MSESEAEGHKEMREGTHLCTCRHTGLRVCGTGMQGQAPAPRVPFIHSQRSSPGFSGLQLLTQPSKVSLGAAERSSSWKCKVQLATKSS